MSPFAPERYLYLVPHFDQRVAYISFSAVVVSPALAAASPSRKSRPMSGSIHETVQYWPE